MNIRICRETESDRRRVELLVAEAFRTAGHSDGNEHILVRQLRECKAFVPELSLVAVADDEIIGHVMFTELAIGNQVHLALAPLSVLPGWQRKGIGSALVNEGHRLAEKLGYGLSVVLGEKGYYSRFGYIPASSFGITAPAGIEEEYYMAKELNQVETPVSGKVIYASPFGME